MTRPSDLTLRTVALRHEIRLGDEGSPAPVDCALKTQHFGVGLGFGPARVTPLVEDDQLLDLARRGVCNNSTGPTAWQWAVVDYVAL